MYYDSSQIEQAKNINLISYLQSKGFTLKKRDNQGNFRPDGTKIDIKGNLWHDWKSGESGNTLSYLTKILGLDFLTAMGELIQNDNPLPRATVPSKLNKPKVFTFESLNITNESRNLFTYLHNTRGIDNILITELYNQKLIVQDFRKNVVFLNYNGSTIVGVDKVGTYGKFKQSLGGTFIIPSVKGKIQKDTINQAFELALFTESPIDTISLYQIFRKRLSNRNVLVVSMGGASKINNITDTMQRFSLSADKVVICTDNDNAGQEVIPHLLRSKGISVKGYFPPKNFKNYPVKDWNDILKININH